MNLLTVSIWLAFGLIGFMGIFIAESNNRKLGIVAKPSDGFWFWFPAAGMVCCGPATFVALAVLWQDLKN